MIENSNESKYLMNWDTKRVWKEEVISNQFIKYLKEQEVEDLIKKGNTQIGIISERDIINWVDQKENTTLWKTEIQHHVCEKVIKDEDDYFVGCEYEDFKANYFFVASLWVTEQENSLIILEHYH